MVTILCIYAALFFDRVQASSEHLAKQRSYEEMKILAPNYPAKKKRKLSSGAHNHVVIQGKKCVHPDYVINILDDPLLVTNRFSTGETLQSCWETVCFDDPDC